MLCIQILVHISSVLLALNLITGGPESSVTLQRFGLKGPVKSVIGRVGYYRNESGVLKEECCLPLYSFTLDRNGTLLSEESTNSPIDPGSLGPPRPKKPIYNAKGQLVGDETYEQDGAVYSKTLFSFDASGIKIEENTYSASGRLSNKKVFASEGRHLLIEEITFNFDGTRYGRWTYDQYDSHDNCIKRTAWEWRERDGKGKWEPDATYYKVITYY